MSRIGLHGGHWNMHPAIGTQFCRFALIQSAFCSVLVACSGNSSDQQGPAGGNAPSAGQTGQLRATGGSTSIGTTPGGANSTTNGSAMQGGAAQGSAAQGGATLTTSGPVARGGAASGSLAAAGTSIAAGGALAIGGAKSNSGTNAGGTQANNSTGTTRGGSSSIGGKSSAGGSTVAVGGNSATAGRGPQGGATYAGTSSTNVATAGTVGTPNVTIELKKQLQTIEGFGFFGAQDTWWSSASSLWSEAWGKLVINDLGLSIWRNEYYSEESGQDANWAKQLPVVKGLKQIADANGVPLKFIYTVWSPPSSMKCSVESVQAARSPCTKHPDGLKNGGTLDPSKYGAYADWLAQGVKNYADAGIELYALSPQNEPMFVEPYNSAVYDIDPAERNSYSRMIQAVAPLVKQAYPKVKIFGTENMLELEGQQWFYSAYMDDAAWPHFDVLAYHGYQDGVAPTAGSQLATYWNYVRTNWAEPHAKASWMTETSGYTDNWSGNNGARALGYAIYSALAYGQVSAWIWWQGSETGAAPGQYTLMGGTTYLGKRYYVSKQFYRFIRPGAKMLQVTSSDSNLFAVAFTHEKLGATTLVVINTATSDKNMVLGGTNLPTTYDAFRTSSSEDCAALGAVTNGRITLKADSITTLVNGNVYE